MPTELNLIAPWAYGFAVVVFVAFAVYLGLGWKGGGLGARVLTAVVLSALWVVAEFLALTRWHHLYDLRVPALLDFARLAAWSVFFAGLLRQANPKLVGSMRLNGFLPLGWGLIATTAISVLVSQPGQDSVVFGIYWAPMLHLLLAIWFLVLIEQVYRNFPEGSRWGIKPIALGLASAFCFDLYLYADATMIGSFDGDVLAIRGAAHAIAMPLVAMSAVRSRDWTFRITVSRELVFHTATLAAAGAYLLLIAAAGYYVRWFGGNWGGALQLGLFFCGLLLLVFLVFSGAVRARFRVLINKHLFAYRYDYRAVWLKFTHALTDAQADRSLDRRVISALADLVESPAGVLWMRGDDGVYRPRGELNMRAGEWTEPASSTLCQLMAERGWIINLEEWRMRPALYGNDTPPAWIADVPEAWLVVPLASAGELIGFVLLTTSRAPVEVNWEVLDLFKTAGQQAASYLNLARATEALLEARKFDSFNRMSAFVVHDLKNVVAQLSLMLKNADRHRHNPEFQDDMLMTVAHASERMRGLMQQLQNKSSLEVVRQVDLAEVCRSLERQTISSGVQVAFALQGGLFVNAQQERLERIIGHVLQNALEATSEHGKVDVDLSADASMARVRIHDTGCGMTSEFIRERLFRPFQTTKHTGMGIGTYEVQQYVAELGGRVSVDSEPDRGSCFTIELPLASRTDVRVEPLTV